jgi:two-component system chemotaxis response regulator CheY
MGLTVLVVDDSSTVRKIIIRCLRQSSLGVARVCEAENGQEALTALQNEPIDAVLTDVNMPVMDGVQLLCAIRQSTIWKSMPVLMITTEASAEAVVDAVAKGATGYIRKPFTAAEISDQLAPVLKSCSRT